MPNDTLTLSPSSHIEPTEPELNLAESSLRRLGLLSHGHQASEREAAIQSALHKFGSKMEFTEIQLRDKAILRQLFDFLNHRFCSVADTPPQMNGIHPQSFGSPSGRWPSGNLTINVNATGCNLNANVVNQIVLNAYAQYQAAQPFFNFTPGGANSSIRVQFGGTNLDPQLGVPGGAIGVGGKPTTGTLFLNAGTTWTPAFLLAVVLHEAGHTLGLSHSTLSTSVMYPFAPTLNALDPETIEAIQSLYGWAPQTRLSDRASTDGPSMTLVSTPSFGGTGSQTLFMAWTGSAGDSGLYFASSSDGVRWSPQQRINGVGSSEGPSLTTFHPPSRDGFPYAGLFMAWKGVGNDHGIYWATNPNLNGWSGQQRVNGVGTSSRPAVVEFNNQMVMAWKGIPGDSGIYWSKFNGSTWSPQNRIAGRGTSHGPALVVFGGQLHMYWKGIDSDDNVYHAVLIDAANGIWGPQDKVVYINAGNLASGQTPIAIGTSNSPVATVRGNELILAWKGVPGDHALWFSRFSNGQYSGQISIPNVGSEAGPGLVNLNGRLVLAWRGINNDRNLYISTLG